MTPDTLAADEPSLPAASTSPAAAAAAPAVTPSKRAVFRRRLGSALFLWAIFAGTVISGSEFCYYALIGALGLVGLWEFYKMLDARRLPNFKLFGLTVGTLFFLGSFWFHYTRPGQPFDFELLAVLAFLFGTFGRQLFVRTRDHSPIETMAYTLFGLLYVPLLFNFITKLIYLPAHAAHHPVGHFYVFYLIAVSKFSDMGAYLVGSLIGRHKMIPHISPSKTWEGFAGALLFSVGISYGLRALMPARLGLLGWVDCAVMGLTLSVAAVIGDLAESIIKRSTGVKDSGHTFPGIGGVLDLIDSLLFTAPILYFYLRPIAEATR
ncbi:MAG: phosphatidate cytidylyltransferase [Verrucomicrobia bacterium]|nr:phosphatidate cytidylyltransferase [Verrucomicrobiota bacterium]